MKPKFLTIRYIINFDITGFNAIAITEKKKAFVLRPD